MRLRLVLTTASLLVALALAALVYAQLSDTQTASGTVNVSTTSADLYFCEPDSTPGPACGSDDSGADETVFETLEDIRPGEIVGWDIRLQNVGSEDWRVTNVTLNISEAVDPGADCPDDSLRSGDPLRATTAGVYILGKDGNPFNDNPFQLPGLSQFGWIEGGSPRTGTQNIKVAAGDFEDVRLLLHLIGSGTENCDGNEWSVSWEFSVA